MKTVVSLVFLSAAILLASPALQDKNAQKEKFSPKQTLAAVKQIWNKHCPIMGEEVDPKVQTVEYKGKVIGFCCKKCIKKFNSNPEKYLKHLSPDGKKFIK